MPRYGTHRRSGRYNDWGRTYKQFSYALLNAGQTLNGLAKGLLGEVAFNYLRKLDSEWPHNTVVTKPGKSRLVVQQMFGGDKDHPWYTGQLHDSVAVRIADRNRTVSVHYMPSAATAPQYMSRQDGEEHSNIIGIQWAHEVAEGKMPYYFLPGLQVQLVVAVPYAEKVNASGRHANFMDALSTDLINAVDEWVMSGGLSRNRLIADDKGARVVGQSNVRYV